MKEIFIFSIIALLIFGCSQENKQQRPIKSDSSEYGKLSRESISKELICSGVYQGVLPCEDSQSIETTLCITEDYQHYQLIEKLPGQSDQAITKGNLNTERGFEEDRNAVVYVLDWDKEENKQSFFVKSTGDSSRIYKLNEDKKMLSSYPLRKIEK